MRWLRLLAPVTYLCKLLGTRALAAFLLLKLFRGDQGISRLDPWVDRLSSVSCARCASASGNF
ncbi:hypothetical protein C3369_03375 [Escherichia sp. ESNIH1]|nr:hypothetical protein C3369_03375 [Escherichia sp. ESNIH1]